MNIKWDQNICTHSGQCVKTLPEVFKIVKGEFVIDTNQATAEEIITTVKQCPSGALILE